MVFINDTDAELLIEILKAGIKITESKIVYDQAWMTFFNKEYIDMWNAIYFVHYLERITAEKNFLKRLFIR